MVDLDLWLPEPAVHTHHRRVAQTDAGALWAAAETIRIGESGLLGSVIRWRVPGTVREQTYREMFTSHPFVALDEGELHLLAGVCGRIWAVRPAFPSLRNPSEFRDWSTPGTVKVLFAQWAAPTHTGAELVSEIRATPVDRRASLRLRGLWPLISRFQGLIGTEPLRLAVRRAEA